MSYTEAYTEARLGDGDDGFATPSCGSADEDDGDDYVPPSSTSRRRIHRQGQSPEKQQGDRATNAAGKSNKREAYTDEERDDARSVHRLHASASKSARSPEKAADERARNASGESSRRALYTADERVEEQAQHSLAAAARYRGGAGARAVADGTAYRARELALDAKAATTRELRRKRRQDSERTRSWLLRMWTWTP